jgi:hypothetical protein
MSPSGFPGYPTPLEWMRPVPSGAMRPTQVRDKKATVRPLRVGGVGSGMRRLGLRALGILLLVVAVVVLVLAFTRFDEGPAPPPGSPAFAEFREEQVRDARLSAALGLGGALSLLGGFGCLQASRRPGPSAPEP